MQSELAEVVCIAQDVTRSNFVSGTFELEAIDALPLLSVLPPFLHLRAGDERGKTFEAVLDMLANEVADSGGPAMGAEALSARLFEIMFIHAVRIHCKQQDTPVTGWLAVIGPASQARGPGHA